MSHPIRIEPLPKTYKSKIHWQTCWSDHLGRRHYSAEFTSKASALAFAREVKKDPSKLHEGFSDIYILWGERGNKP
jgi:hypothetical protein